MKTTGVIPNVQFSGIAGVDLFVSSWPLLHLKIAAYLLGSTFYYTEMGQ